MELLKLLGIVAGILAYIVVLLYGLSLLSKLIWKSVDKFNKWRGVEPKPKSVKVFEPSPPIVFTGDGKDTEAMEKKIKSLNKNVTPWRW